MPDSAELPYRRLVAAIWVLVRTAGTPGADPRLVGAANDCWQRLGEVLGESRHFVLQQRGGALFTNGLRIRPDVASFAATAGLTALLQDNDISELLLLPEASPQDLATLACCWHLPGARDSLDAALRQRGCMGVHVAHAGQDAALPVEPEGDGATAAPSQLGAVFTMQRFAAALGPVGPLSGVRARSILQSVLHALLRRPRQLDLLARLLREPLAHAEAVRACVLAVRTAEELGWNDERSIGAGIAALIGASRAADGDLAERELVAAAQTVAAMIGAHDDPRDAIDRLRLRGELPETVGEAMDQALAGPARAGDRQ